MNRRTLLATTLAGLVALITTALVAAAGPAAAVGGRNLPANGRTLFLVGQTTPDLSAFKSQVLDADPGFPRAGGVTLYTNITPGVCNGLTATCNLGGNVFNFNQTLSEYPGAALAVGLYLSDAPGCYNQPLRAIIGRNDADLLANNLGQQYRDNLDDLIRYLKNTGRAVYLRVGYEFDGPWNCYNTDFYKQAFRVVKQRIDALGASNVATVWQSATYAKDGDPAYNQDFSNPTHLDTWYPGDAYVDWVGLSTFYWDGSYRQYQWACDTPTSSPRTLYDRMVTFGRSHDKPAMIAESTPQAYRTSQLDASCTNINSRRSLNGDWTKIGAWYDEYFGYINANQDTIRAVSYINSNWEAIAQFACPPGASSGQPGCSDGYWGNSRVQDDADIYANFKRELRNDIFVNGTLSGRGADWGGGRPPSPSPTASPSPTSAPTSSPTASPSPTTSPTVSPSPTSSPTGGSRNPYATVEAESFDAQSGVQVVNLSGAGGGAATGNTHNGDWIRLDRMAFGGTTPRQVAFRYSSPRGTNEAFTVEFRAGSATGPLLGAPGVLGTGGQNTLKELVYNITGFPAGTTSIAVVFRANDGNQVANLDWVRFLS